MKFGIDITGTVKEAVILYGANGNTLWQDSINIEMNNSWVSLKLYDKGEKDPVGHTGITCHLIFDLKLDMTRKERYVVGGHITGDPTYITYSGVVSRDTVHIKIFSFTVPELLGWNLSQLDWL